MTPAEDEGQPSPAQDGESSGGAETDGAAPDDRRRRPVRLLIVCGVVVVFGCIAAVAFVAVRGEPDPVYGRGYRLVAASPSTSVDPSAPTTTTTVPGQVGIDKPITSQGLQLQLYAVTRERSYEQSVPSNPNDTLLVVKAKVFSGSTSSFDNKKWPVTLTDDTGRKDTPGITGSNSISGRFDEASWVFAVSKSATSFTLEVPGGTVLHLDALLASGPRTAPTTTPTTKPDPNLLLRESYVAPDGWFEGRQGTWTVAKKEGRYVVSAPAKTTAGRLVRAPITGAYPVAAVDVDVAKVSPGKALYGLACRDDGHGRSYQALVDATGYFRLSRVDRAAQGSKTILEAKSRAEYVGGLDPAATHLTLLCSGSAGPNQPVTITLSVNGRKVAEATDRRGLAAGGVGLAVVARDQPVEVAFSNFVATKR